MTTRAAGPAATFAMLALMLGILAPTAAAKPAGVAPDITAISPDHGLRGSTVTVTGRDFGGPRTRISVGGVMAELVSATGARATFIVPAAAPLGRTIVRLANPSGQSDAVPFTVDFDNRIHPVLDAGRSSARVIGPDGGAVSATGADGTGYRLELPAGALDAEHAITLTPVASVADLPLSGGLRAAAHFEPSGLSLAVPGSLTITLASVTQPLVAFAYAGNGDDFAIVASTMGASTVVIAVEHFSGAGAGTPTAADFDALVAPLVGSLGQLTYSQVVGLAELAIQWERMFGEDFCETRSSCGGALQRVHDSLVALAEAACLTGHEDLSTTPALGAALEAGRLLTVYEVSWDELRLVDEALGAGSIAPDSIPIAVAGLSTAPGCRAAILGRIIDRATDLAQAAPFATSDVGSSAGSDDVSNIGWLFELAAAATLLGLDDLVNQATQAGGSIVDDLLMGTPAAPTSGAVARAEAQPFEPAPAAGQEPFVITRANVDGDAATSAWEWLRFLLVQAQHLGLEAGAEATSLETSLAGIIERSAATCQSDEAAGQADLVRGRKYAVVIPLLVSEFDDALAACGVGIAISPTATSVPIGGQVQFTATVTGTSDTGVTWSSPDASDPIAGLFLAPMTPGSYRVVATVTAHPLRTATAVVTVTGDVDVTVTPEFPGVLAVGDTVQFSATVTGGATNAVTWTATGGSISEDGLFSATTIGLASATATSVENPDISSTVVFEIGGTVTVTILPGDVTVEPGGTYQFSGQVTGTQDDGLLWTASCGTITSTGLFTAPVAETTCVITAASVAEPSATGLVTVTVKERTTVLITEMGGWLDVRGDVYAIPAPFENVEPVPFSSSGCMYDPIPLGFPSTTGNCTVSSIVGNGGSSSGSTVTPTLDGDSVTAIGGSASSSAFAGWTGDVSQYRGQVSGSAVTSLQLGFTPSDYVTFTLTATLEGTNSGADLACANSIAAMELRFGAEYHDFQGTPGDPATVSYTNTTNQPFWLMVSTNASAYATGSSGCTSSASGSTITWSLSIEPYDPSAPLY